MLVLRHKASLSKWRAEMIERPPNTRTCGVVVNLEMIIDVRCIVVQQVIQWTGRRCWWRHWSTRVVRPRLTCKYGVVSACLAVALELLPLVLVLSCYYYVVVRMVEQYAWQRK